MKSFVTIGRILGTERMKMSPSGNPKCKVRFEDEDGEIHYAVTSTDAACGFSVENVSFTEEKSAKITYHFTRKGNEIIDYCVPAKS